MKILKMPLWAKIVIGLAAGVICGVIFKEKASVLKPLGTIFINGIKMVIVPLVFASLITGVTSAEDMKKMGRIALKSIIIFFATTIIAVVIGLGMSLIMNPGKGLHMNSETVHQVSTKSVSLIDTIVNIIPSNPIDAMAKGEILQIIVFAIFIGVAINLAGSKGRIIKDFFDGFAEIMYKLTGLIMEFAPIGVFALIASVVGEYGIEFLIPLFKVIATAYIASLIHLCVVYSGLLALVSRLNPLKFLSGFLDAILIAFSTSSSSAALPVSFRCTQENLGVSKGISSFVLPLGTTINMNGTAIYQGVCAVFIAQAYGLELTIVNYITITATALLAAIGTAGVPGAGMIMLSMVLSSVGLPIEGIALIAGIDRILDMARSTINVVGDGLAAVMVAKSENELDLNVYNSSKKKA